MWWNKETLQKHKYFCSDLSSLKKRKVIDPRRKLTEVVGRVTERLLETQTGSNQRWLHVITHADSYFYTQQDWDVFSGGQTTAEQSQAEAVMICSIRRQETEVFPDTLGNFRARDVFRFTFLQWAGVWLSWRGLSVAPLIPPDRRVRRYLNKLESCSSSRSCCPSLLPGDKRCLHSWRHEVWH